MPIDRRAFMAQLGTAVMGAAWGLQPAADQPQKRLERFGIEIGPLFPELANDLDGTLAKLAAMGYTEVEPLWYLGTFGKSPRQWRAALARAGLRAPSTLVLPGAFTVGWKRHLGVAREMGFEYVSCVYVGTDGAQSLDDWREWADLFNRAGKLAREAGIWLAFHNEPPYMTPLEGRIPYDLFLERTDPDLVRLELDLGNMVRAGHDPVKYLTRHPDRYWLFHLKDIPRPPRQDEVELGTGRVDFRHILPHVRDPERKHFFVEFVTRPSSPMEVMQRCAHYLTELRF